MKHLKLFKNHYKVLKGFSLFLDIKRTMYFPILVTKNENTLAYF